MGAVDSVSLTPCGVERPVNAKKLPPPHDFGGKSRNKSDYFRLNRGFSALFSGLVSRRASISFVTTILAIVSITSPAAHAATLIRCPDWQRYVTAAALRTAPPKQSFDAALAAGRTGESRAANANPQAGQGTPTAARGTGANTRANTSAIKTTPLPSADRSTRSTRPASAKPTRSARKPNQPASQTAATCQYTIVSGDTLSKIAATHLGNIRRWPELAKANTLSGSSILRIGQRLHLPCAPGGKLANPPTPAATTDPQLVIRPLPVWTARPGEFASDVVTRWAKRAGHTVVRDGVEEWKITVPVTIQGSFKDALDQLVVGFEGSGRPLAISIYANKVIRIGRPL